ncbi:MAG: UV DNA damage repair endonuclease UvsE [Clostridiaceae bacterium]|nr:UV DNA damage repair endonuclease UvsE [Clostridiaceae bacterium]
MSIGYACLALGLPGSEMKNCRIKNASKEHLLSLIENNLESLDIMIDYNTQHGIKLFRISSDLIPFGSNLAKSLHWEDLYREKLASIACKIKKSRMRVSMHPGQYTVLNSPNEAVAERAIQDLNYHTKVLDCFGLGSEHKIILHLGGKYGNKEHAIKLFISRYRGLSNDVKCRLVLENDDKMFNIEDVLKTASVEGIPVVYDNLHNTVNPADKLYNDFEWIKKCRETWKKEHSPQKIHYSQQHPDKRPGAHSDFIAIDKFLEFYRQLPVTDIDIMLEVKDKNLSALKCINCVTNMGISKLETEWAHYKYCILERSPEHYNSIRKLLNDKSTYPAKQMYQMIEMALQKPIIRGNAINAAQHVWGYFKKKASEYEKKRFEIALQKFELGEIRERSVKNILYTMARKYKEEYLLNSYYFQI